MDGWETRRKRVLGHDFAVVKLAVPGRIEGFDVDTAFFTGNYPPACRIMACSVENDPVEETVWTEILPTVPLGPSAHHFFPCSSGETWTHVRLHILPDGGVARKVPACAADAQRVQQGRSPWIRTVDVNGAQLPYWQAGPDYAPWVQGYYRRYESDPVISGLAVGGLGLVGLGPFSALFDDF